MDFILLNRIHRREQMIEINERTIFSMKEIAKSLEEGLQKKQVEAQIKRLEEENAIMDRKNRTFSW